VDKNKNPAGRSDQRGSKSMAKIDDYLGAHGPDSILTTADHGGLSALGIMKNCIHMCVTHHHGRQ